MNILFRVFNFKARFKSCMKRIWSSRWEKKNANIFRKSSLLQCFSDLNDDVHLLPNRICRCKIITWAQNPMPFLTLTSLCREMSHESDLSLKIPVDLGKKIRERARLKCDLKRSTCHSWTPNGLKPLRISNFQLHSVFGFHFFLYVDKITF